MAPKYDRHCLKPQNRANCKMASAEWVDEHVSRRLECRKLGLGQNGQGIGVIASLRGTVLFTQVNHVCLSPPIANRSREKVTNKEIQTLLRYISHLIHKHSSLLVVMSPQL